MQEVPTSDPDSDNVELGARASGYRKRRENLDKDDDDDDNDDDDDISPENLADVARRSPGSMPPDSSAAIAFLLVKGKETIESCSSTHSPLVKANEFQEDEPQPLPFFGGEFSKELCLDLIVRIMFAVPFWAMITYEWYFLCLIWAGPFFGLFGDQTNYRHFVEGGSTGCTDWSSVVEYIRKIQTTPILTEGYKAPMLDVESSHKEGGDEHSDGTKVQDFFEQISLTDLIKDYEVKYTGVKDVEDHIKSVLHKVSQEGKVFLAIESTFSVEIDQDLMKTITQEMIRMQVKCDKTTAMQGNTKAGRGVARFLVHPNGFKKILFIDPKSKKNTAEDIYFRSDADEWIYYLARVAIGPALVNRFLVCGKTLHYSLNFKVKINPTGATRLPVANDGSEPQEEV